MQVKLLYHLRLCDIATSLSFQVLNTYKEVHQVGYAVWLLHAKISRCQVRKLKLIETYKEMEKKAGKIGLEVNERKTEYMIVSTSESRRKPQDLKKEGKLFAGVSSLKYLGNVINNGNRNNNCVKESIQAGNRAYVANLSTLKSKIISKAVEIQVYKSLIRPVATCGAETWTLTVVEENALRMFERKVMRKIYGPVMEKDMIYFILHMGFYWLAVSL
jgi:hypothetical protein